MYRVFFKTNDSIISCECENITYLYKDSCVHITDGTRSYKCNFDKSEISNLLTSCTKNGYITFQDKVFITE